MPVSEALQREQQAENAYYKQLRQTGALSRGAALSARSGTVGAARAQTAASINAATTQRLKKFGMVRGPKSAVDAPLKEDTDLGEAGFERMFNPNSPGDRLKNRGVAGSGAGGKGVSGGANASTAAAGATGGAGSRGIAVNPRGPAEPEVVLDGSNIPRYLQFNGKAKSAVPRKTK